ncbi:MAG: aspartate/glutamate racemase family protein [Gammaproteobacteria bacterium]|nr:aspartate/glutamate racemase family protein [Gammaproteobacteria bacterium]
MNVSHQDAIGILMLDTAFERFYGDIGNPDTWAFPVRYRVIDNCTPAEVIRLKSDDSLTTFFSAIDELIAEGVCGITTTCGFLGLYQSELAAHASVPVATSALLQTPVVERLLPPGKRAGILTFNANALSKDHLQAVGAAVDTPITGFSTDSVFYRWILEGRDDVSASQLQDDVVAHAKRLQQHNPEVGAIVSECTNLTPFARAIRQATGLPVYDMVTLMHWFRAGLQPPEFITS